MLSHIAMMSVRFHSRGLVLTCTRSDSGVCASVSPSLVTTRTGSRQQAQYDSMRTSLPANGGIMQAASDSIAHPAQQWNRPSTWISACVG